MKERILKTSHGQFELRQWDGKNGAGMVPVGDKLLVRVDPAMSKTRGGVIITDQSAETQTLSSTTGVLIALGEGAFMWDSDRAAEWQGKRPKAGDRVYFQRYAGQEYTGDDGEMYRIMQDKSIAAVALGTTVR